MQPSFKTPVIRDATRRARDLIARIHDEPQARAYFYALITSYAQMGANVIVQVALVPLYLRHLGKAQFGVLMTILAFVNYSALGVGWMSGGVARILGERAAVDDRPGFASAYALMKFVYVGYAIALLTVMLLAVLVGAHFLFPSASPAELSAIRLAAGSGAFYFVLQYDLAVERMALAALNHQAAANSVQILNLVTFAACVVPWLLSGGGLGGVLICMAVGIVAARVASAVYWRRLGMSVRWQRPDATSRALLRRLVGSMGGGYFLYGILGLTLTADVMLVAWLGGPTVVAEFTLVWKVAEVILQLLWRIPEMLAPALVIMDARGERDVLRGTYVRAGRISTAAALGVGVLYALLGHRLVSLWVGANNAPKSMVAYALAGAAIFWSGSARLPAIYAYSTVMLRRLNVVIAAELVGKFAVAIALFPRIGYLAVPLGTSVVHVLGVAIAYRKLAPAPAGLVASASEQPSTVGGG